MVRKIVVSSLFMFLFYAVFCQDQQTFEPQFMDYATPAEYEIADITISGVQFLDNNILINMTGLRIGQTISVPGDDMSKILQKFWAQGLFSDVKITAKKIEGNKIYLDIFLKERPRLSKIDYTGVKKSEIKDIDDKLKIRSGSQVTDNLLNNITSIIKKHYTEKGYYNTKVTIVQSDDPAKPNRVNLKVLVEKNVKMKIGLVEFNGNKVFTTNKLRRKLKKTKQRGWNIFASHKLVEKNYKEDKEKLIKFYNDNGYRDASIVSDSVKVLNYKRLKVVINLDEGRKYYFRNISWVGNTKYTSDVLTKLLGIKKGDIFNQSLMDKRLFMDEDAVNSLYLDNGYLFFSLTPVEVKIENDSIDLEMRISEGKQATINKIIITGNTKTNEHVVRRELRTKPGELFSKQAIIRSVRELATLGHFDPEKIEPNPIPNQSDGTVDLEYKLVEKANDQLEVSGGYGAGMFVGTVGVRFSNFAAKDLLKPKAWRPVPSGDGQTLSLRVQSNGSYYRGANATFVEPWFGGKKPNSLSVSLFYSLQSGNYGTAFSSVSTNYFRVVGGSVGLGRRLEWPDDFFTLYNEIGFQHYLLNNYNTFYFPFSNGNSNNISFRTTFGRNSVDQPIYPRTGSSFTLGLQLTPPYSLFRKSSEWMNNESEKYKWIEFHKWTFKGATYTSLVGNLVMSTNTQFGILGRYNKNYGYSPFEKFDVGGSGLTGYSLYGTEPVALRGYSDHSVTPVTADGKEAGNMYDKFSLELRYPLTLQPSATIYGLTFIEGGNAWADFSEFNPFMIKRSAGIGIRAFLPMFGMLGVDWGYGFDKIPNNPGASGSQFHFVIGQQF
jgi:outer membrane protein insertion porin family